MLGVGPVAQERKRVRRVQPLRALRVLHHRRQGVRAAYLGYRHARAIAVHQRPQALEEYRRFRLVRVVHMALHQHWRSAALAFLQRRVVLQSAAMEIQVRSVETEAIHAAVQPKARYLQHRILHGGAVKVQVRHLRQEVVQVVLLPPRIPAPRGAAHPALPIVRRCAIWLRVRPHVPIRLGVGAAAAAFLEPRVFGSGVAPHLVDDDLQPQPMRLEQQGIEVRQGAEERVHAQVVRHVVAEVAHGAGEKRRQPDAIHAQLRHIRQGLRHAGQVADAVAIGVS